MMPEQNDSPRQNSLNEQKPGIPYDKFMTNYFNAPGVSGIFNFPFRIYACEPLTIIAVEDPSTGFRYKITFIEKNDSTSRPTVPFEYWPNFETSPKLPSKVDSFPGQDMTYSGIEADRVYENIVYYSQLRLDIWANNLSTEVLEKFCARFLELTRLYTDQYWINAYEANFSLNNMVSAFPIDELGRCLATPLSAQKIVAHVFKPLDNEFVSQLFMTTIRGDTVDEYWRVYFEASNLFVRGFLDQAVLQLAISLEISRYVNLRPFMVLKTETAAGPTFAPPFNETDLRKNLNENLRSVIGRSLKDEKPELWEYVDQLYKARQQVAHGKKAAFQLGERKPLVGVDTETFLRWVKAVRNTNGWLIDLKNSASQ